MEEMRDASAQDSVYEGSRLLQNISILQDKIQGKNHTKDTWFNLRGQL